MGRRRLSERDVLKVLTLSGVQIPCFRCREPLSMLDVVEREHLHEMALGGPEDLGNFVYSHAACHALITNGTPSTTAGSSKHRIAKTKGTRAAKFAVEKKPLDEPHERQRRYGNTTFRSTPR